MKRTSSKKRSAFSLIELSIVLIIIGLLVAGITGGASLIKSSELRSVMGEARGYAVAVNAFFNQFNAYPGDYGVTVGGVSDALGDADSRIEYYSGEVPSGGTRSESAAAFVHLRYSGTIDNLPATIALVEATTVPTFGTSANSGSNAPSSKSRGNGWLFDYNTTSTQNVAVFTGTGVAVAAGSTNTLVNGTSITAAALIGADLLSIDAKLDDGVSTAGKVRGIDPVSQTCISGTGYITSSGTTKICAFSFQIDVS